MLRVYELIRYHEWEIELMTEEADLKREASQFGKASRTREMLETAADAQRAEVNRIAADFLQSGTTEWKNWMLL